MSEFFYLVDNKITTIQRAYREYRYREVCNEKAVHIQRIARGFLVRISEQYILSKVYAKVPSFWKEIINKTKSTTSTLLTPITVTHEKLIDLTASTAQRIEKVDKLLMSHCNRSQRSTSSRFSFIGDFKLTGRNSQSVKAAMPFWLPSAFDGEAYASLTDGRHVHIFGPRPANSNTLHRFALHLWPQPPTAKEHEQRVKTELFDPHEFTLNVSEQARTVLMCERCVKRFRMISCFTCSRGFCFQCAIRVHSLRSQRDHDMKFVDPQVQSTRAMDKSLVFHVDMANHLSHDLRHIVKNMHNKSEVNRIRNEKLLKEQMEGEERVRKAALEMALTEDRRRHDASDRIASLYYFHKAKVEVVDKRVHRRVEALTKQKSLFVTSAIMLQRRFRMFATRKVVEVLAYRAAELRFEGKSGREVKFRDLHTRLQFEIHQRRMMERAALLNEMQNRFVSLCTMHTTNIEYWLRVNGSFPQKIAALEEKRVALNSAHESVLSNDESSVEGSVSSATKRQNRPRLKKSSDNDSTTSGGKEAKPLMSTARKIANEVILKSLRIGMANVDHLVDNIRLQQYWIAQVVRADCRRLSYVKERYLDTVSRLSWIPKELAMVERVVFNAEQRVGRLSRSQDSALPVAWLQVHRAHAVRILTALDAQQESIVLDELQRLRSDEKQFTDVDVILASIVDSVRSESQFSSERVHLDRSLLSLLKGSDEAVRCSDQAYALKKKQTNLIGNVIDPLKLGLQAKLNEEDEATVAFCAFPSDDPHMAAEDMPANITAVLLDKFKSGSHFSIVDFINMYLVQPWLSKQAVEDVRIEDDIVLKELESDTMQHELRALREKIRESEEKVRAVEVKISDLQEELDFAMREAPKNVYSNRDDEDVAEFIRQESIRLFKQELKVNEAEKVAYDANIEKMKTLIDPVSERINGAANEIVQLKDNLTRRAVERKRLESVFFDLEEKASADLVNLIGASIEQQEEFLHTASEQLAVCLEWSKSQRLKDKLEKEQLTIEECSALGIQRHSQAVDSAVRSCQAVIHPRSICSPEVLREGVIDNRKLILDLDCKHYKFICERLTTELKFARNYKAQRVESENLLQTFQQSLLALRRQKSIQKELEERRNRLEGMRFLRLQQMVADRAAMLARKAAEQKRKEKKFADELKHSKVVRNANRLRKRVNLARDRALATLTGKEAPLDPEQVRMMEALEQSGKENLEDKPHGVRNIKITVGEEESSKFLVQMQLLMDKKLPYYVRLEKAFGNQTYLWYQLTYNTQQFITTIDLGHTERNHPQYKDLSPSNYEAVSHPSLKLILWVKRDVTKLAGVGAIDFAFSEAEEKTFIDNGFEIAGPSLFEFDLPDSTIWIQRLDKVAKKVTKMNTAVATNHAISQLAKVRKLLSENPNNKNLKELEHKFIAELKSCYKREEEAEVEDPLQAAKKLMALDDDQVEQWIDAFAAIDKDKLGRVTLEQVFGELQEYMTDSGRLVFASMDAVGDDGYMEFGDFVLSVGTFCFFGLEEVLKFLYTNADKDKKGVITQAEYIDLLNDLHPFDKAKAVRVLKTMKRRPTEEISFETFVSDHEKFPMMLFPQLHLQRIMRRRFMGDAWWVNKLVKYRETREKLVMEAESLDKRAEAELKAFTDNEERKARMEERSRAILQETSAVKLAILNARQFTDALG